MDRLLAQAIAVIEKRMPLAACALPPELAETKYLLNVLTLRCYNWTAEKLRKVYAMRMTVRVPSLDIIGMAFYPVPECDAPIFAFDLSVTSKKVIAYINPVPVSPDEFYYRQYIEPFSPLREAYRHFPPHKAPAWMQAYNTPCTIYAMTDRSCLEELKACVLQYCAVYTDLLAQAQPLEDAAQRMRVEAFHAAYIRDLTTQDRSQVMLGKIIGRQKAARIFNEVLV